MNWIEITALITSGLLVGFINTLAGGGTIISLSLFMFFGLPATLANGTNRIAVLIQTITSVACFKQQKVLDVRKGIQLSVPAVIGSVLGARIAIDMSDVMTEKIIGVVMLLMLFILIYQPQKWLTGQKELIRRKMSIKQVIIFFLIGVYGGFIHIGVGYFIIAAVVLNAGYDLVRANAIKVLIVLMYAPLTLLVFLWNDQVNFKYGLVHAIGNVIGAFLATRFAVSWGANFVRWAMIVFILVTAAHLFGIFDFKEIFRMILN